MSRGALALALVSLAVAAVGQQTVEGQENAVMAAPGDARGAVAAPAAARPAWQIVYTRQPRATAPVPGTPVEEAANWQHASDVGRINGGIAEADVVIDDLHGHVKVIHNCTTVEGDLCRTGGARQSGRDKNRLLGRPRQYPRTGDGRGHRSGHH